MTEKIEKVNKVDKAVKNFQNVLEQPLASGEATNKEYFDRLMGQDPNKKVQPEEQDVAKQRYEKKAPSLMDEVADVNRKIERLSEYTSDDLVAQAKDAVTKIDELRTQLAQPELQIRGSVQHLLKTKLSDINDNLKLAFSKAGLDYVEPDQKRAGPNPVRRFLDLLTHGQSQLESLSGHVQGLSARKEEISPADLLALQLKVSHIQQELEFFTNLLNKSLESTKTLMNVQV